MLRIYKIGIRHERVTNNPVQHVETRSKTNYKTIVITPQQTLAILNSLPSPLHYTLILTCAATALPASEILSLRWADILWNENRIRISKRWAKGEDGETKTESSDGYVPLHPLLAAQLRQWRQQTPYAKETDFVFPSMKAKGKLPLYASTFVADHLRPAALKAGVAIIEEQRFGLHNLRHSLYNWLVNKAKVDRRPCKGFCVTRRYKRRWISTPRKTAMKHGRRRAGSLWPWASRSGFSEMWGGLWVGLLGIFPVCY